MNSSLIKTIFIRLLIVGAAVIVLAFAYLMVRVALAPVSVPPAPPIQKNVAFDTRLDITKNATFTRMRPLGAVNFEPMNLGRDNPFVPVPTTTIAALIATTTPVATSTLMTTTTPYGR